MRNLVVGDSEYAGPMVEHWHGAADFSDAQYVQVNLLPSSTIWMDPVTQDDYVGNDNGFESRAKFLESCANPATRVPLCP